MNTIRIMSIIGIVISALGIMVFYGFEVDPDGDVLAGWLIIVSIWALAQSITSFVQVKKINKTEEQIEFEAFKASKK
jgi:hypothetical protein